MRVRLLEVVGSNVWHSDLILSMLGTEWDIDTSITPHFIGNSVNIPLSTFKFETVYCDEVPFCDYKLDADAKATNEIIDPKKASGVVKAPFHATPKLAIVQMNNVMAGGGHKYGDYNYTKQPAHIELQLYLAAIERHMLLFGDGLDTDVESGMSHLAHVMSCCAIIIEAMAVGTAIDNRYKTGKMLEALKESADLYKDFQETIPAKS